jgi:hypothetical protein
MNQFLVRACSAFPDSALLVAGKCSLTRSKLRLPSSSRLDSENGEQALVKPTRLEGPPQACFRLVEDGQRLRTMPGYPGTGSYHK